MFSTHYSTLELDTSSFSH